MDDGYGWRRVEVWGSPIPAERVRSVWERLFPGWAMPEITAMLVSQEEFDKFDGRKSDYRRKYSMVNEWGREITPCALAARNKAGYWVLILRQVARTNRELDYELSHELGHIGRGECDALAPSPTGDADSVPSPQ